MEVNEYDTATLWRYRIETVVQVAPQQKHSKQVDRLRWIVSRKIYAAAKGDCNEKVRRGNPAQPRGERWYRGARMRTKAGDRRPRVRKRSQYAPNEAKYNQNSNWKARIIPKPKPAAHLQTSGDPLGSCTGIARMCLDLNYATKIYIERELKTNVVN